MNLNDSLNRQRTNVEKLLSETINNNNKITNLVDAYRITNNEGVLHGKGEIAIQD
jgi:hemin uptake protein HemP